MKIQDLLNQYKRQNNITNDYIADYCGVTKSTVSRWCTGKIRRIAPETLEKLTDMLGVNMEDMTRISQLAPEKPILGTVKAGYGLLAEENLEGYIGVSEDEDRQGDYFLRVTGDSMKDAHIHDGDLLFVKSCTDVTSGSIAVLLMGGEEVTVKKLVKKPDAWILHAANEEVEDKEYSLQDIVSLPVQIIGKAIYSKTEL